MNTEQEHNLGKYGEFRVFHEFHIIQYGIHDIIQLIITLYVY